MALDWDDLRILVALDAAGSVSAAARALKVDHSTVSRRLAALEDGLGARMVTRSPDGLVWTDAGRAALTSARAIEAELVGLARRIDQASSVEGTVRVSVPSGMATLLSRWLAPMRETHPKLRVEVTGATHQVDLRRREADLAVRMAQPTQPDLVARLAVTLGWALYASVDYLARRGTPSAVDDLAGHDLVLYAPPMTSIAGAAWLEQHQAGGAPTVRVENTASAILAMVDGLGIGVIPCYLAADQATLRRVFPEVVASNRGWVVYHEDDRERAAISAVADEILAVFDRERALLSGA